MPSRTEISRSLQEDDYPGLGRYVWRPGDGGLEWSKGLVSIYGRKEAPRSEAEFMACLHPDDRLRVEGETEAFLTGTGNSYTHSFRIVRPDGEIRHVIDRARIDRDEAGRVTAIHGMNMDITGLPHAGGTRIHVESHPVDFDDSDLPRVLSDRERLEVGQRTSGLALADIDYRTNTISLGSLAARLFGLGDDAITVSREVMHAVFHPDDQAFLAAEIRRSLDPVTGGTLETEHRIVWPDGSIRWVRIQKRIEFATIQGHLQADRGVLAALDITDRVETETKLRESEERLLLAQQTAGIGVWDLDLQNGRTVWTDGLYDLLQIERGTPPSPDLFFRYVHPKDEQALRRAFEEAIAASAPFEAEFRVILPDGRLRHMVGRGRATAIKNGRATRFTGINYDITDRIGAELRLRESEARLRTILDETSSMVGIVSLDGILQEANRIALAAGGVTREDVIGKPFWETHWWTHDPAEAARLKEGVTRAVGGETVRFDARIRTGDGSIRDIDFQLSPVMDETGQVALLVPSALDITDRKRHEEHISTLLKEVNHRSKNLLSLVKVIAKRTTGDGHDDFIRKFSDRLSALAANQDILVRSDWDAVDLETLIVAQLAHFGDLLGSRIRIDGQALTLRPESAEKLGMAIHELATNAGKYGALSGASGFVQITWRTEETNGTPHVILEWCEEGGPKVVTPARTGFGSLLAGEILEAGLEGTVTADYRHDGLRWTLSCPLENLTMSPDGAARTTAPQATDAAHSGILVVDDDTLLAMSVSDALRDAGFNVVGPAHNVSRALALISTARPDLAILDVNLGRETSEPIAQELQRLGVPFICVSAYSATQIPRQLQTAPFLAKPFEDHALVAAVRATVAANA